MAVSSERVTSPTLFVSAKKSSLQPLSQRSSYRAGPYQRFMEQIENTPLNLDDLMKPRKLKVPTYLKEDYPDPRYFACKKFIARIPEDSDRPSADALDLIISKIYRRTLRMRKKRKPPKTRREQEIVEEDDFLYLEFFGDQSLQRIREDTASVGLPKDRRHRFIQQTEQSKNLNYRFPLLSPGRNPPQTASGNKTYTAGFLGSTDCSSPKGLPTSTREVRPFDPEATDLLSKFKSHLGSVPESRGENYRSMSNSQTASPKTKRRPKLNTAALQLSEEIDFRSLGDDRLNTSSTMNSARQINGEPEVQSKPLSWRERMHLPLHFSPRVDSSRQELLSQEITSECKGPPPPKSAPKRKKFKTVRQSLNTIYKKNERRVQDALLRASRLINPTPLPGEDSALEIFSYCD